MFVAVRVGLLQTELVELVPGLLLGLGAVGQVRGVVCATWGRKCRAYRRGGARPGACVDIAHQYHACVATSQDADVFARSLVDVHLRLNIVSLHQQPATALARSRSTPLRASAVDTERVAQRTT